MGQNDIIVEGRRIGPDAPVFVIAEIGVNHNGDVGLAREMIAAAQESGADCVKFQTFRAERVASAEAPKARYQLDRTDGTESQVAMLKALELSEDAHADLIAESRARGLVFSSTPYNEEDIDFLTMLGTPLLKAASIHCAEPHFLAHMAATGRPMILSTGMASWAEVDSAVAAITRAGGDAFVLLQCTTDYPSRVEDANLRAMSAMADRYGRPVGYSAHTLSHIPIIAAIARGACVIERHFTLDAALPGPDHSTSDTPTTFAELVRAIRETETALGSAEKAPTAAERENMPGMRRSLFARRAIPAGTIVTDQDLICKRPATGMTPRLWDSVVGRRARRAIAEGSQLSADDLDG